MVYITLFESFVRWLESRGSSYETAVFRAGVAFSFYSLMFSVSVAILLDMFVRLPVASWIDDHPWFVWAVAALIGVPHWYIARNVASRREKAKGRVGPSRLTWAWYVVPVLAIFVTTVALALARKVP